VTAVITFEGKRRKLIPIRLRIFLLEVDLKVETLCATFDEIQVRLEILRQRDSQFFQHGLGVFSDESVHHHRHFSLFGIMPVPDQ